MKGKLTLWKSGALPQPGSQPHRGQRNPWESAPLRAWRRPGGEVLPGLERATGTDLSLRGALLPHACIAARLWCLEHQDFCPFSCSDLGPFCSAQEALSGGAQPPVRCWQVPREETDGLWPAAILGPRQRQRKGGGDGAWLSSSSPQVVVSIH